MKVLIIDEQELFRAGVRQVLSKHSDFEILECDLANNPINIIESDSPDVVLIGSRLAEQSWLELGRKITRYYPNTKVVMFSPDPNDEELFQVIKTGAIACLNKNILADDLVSTIRRASNGEYPINDAVITHPMLAKRVLTQFQNLSNLGKSTDSIITPLTNRETQILSLVAGGNSNKQIAAQLQISEQTIKNHVSAILRKLNANDRAHAVVLAIRRGFISIDTITVET